MYHNIYKNRSEIPKKEEGEQRVWSGKETGRKTDVNTVYSYMKFSKII